MGLLSRTCVLCLVVAALLAGCVNGLGSSDSARLRAEAQAALSRWADAVAAAQAAGFVPVRELTGQIGDWEEAVGENNKIALMAGVVEAAAPLPTDSPADGDIEWPDGTTTTASLISAAQAIADIRADSVQPCPECQPLRVTDASLMPRPFETSRGEAIVPMWAFTVEGTRVVITRVAIAGRVVPQIPAWNPDHAPIGISVDSGTISLDGLTLTVSFVGAPRPASEPCGADYAGESVESDLAVVVLVHEHGNPIPAACLAMGRTRTASVRLASPLGDRAVLEVREGRPVAVTPAP